MIEIKEFIKKLIKAFNDENITDVEVYYSKTESTNINIQNGEVETFRLNNDEGINVSGNYKNKYSMTYIEKYDDASIKEAIKNIKDTSTYNNKPERKNHLTDISLQKTTHKTYNADIDIVIEKLKEVQKQVEKIDERVVFVPRCSYHEQNTKIYLCNDQDVQLEDNYAYTVGMIGAVAQSGEIKNNGFAFQNSDSFENIDYNKLAKEAVKDAINALDATSLTSGKYDILFENKSAANIFACFLPMFYQDTIKINSNRFIDKNDKQVATSKLNIVEDPLYINGRIKRTFDDEGIKTYKKYIIQNGVLKNTLKSCQYGTSTGNAFRKSYKDNIAISSANAYIEKGNISTEDMIKNLKEGIMITNIDGLGAGINTVTGDFSLISNGFYIQNGKIIKSLNQITVAGNFYNLLNKIVNLSSDVATSYEECNFFESPSILVEGLMIGGL